MPSNKLFETKASLRDQLHAHSLSNLYVTTKIRGFYVSMYIKVPSGIVKVKVREPRDTSFHTHWLSSWDQAVWLPVNLVTVHFSRESVDNMVEMGGRVGTRIPGLFVANEEVDRPLQIVYTPENGVGWVVEIRAAGDGVQETGDT